MGRHFKDDFTIVIAGQAGQGIESVSNILAHILKKHGHHVFVSKEVMSRVRGGINSISLRVSTQRRDGFVARIDIFVALDPGGYAHAEQRFDAETIFMGVDDPTTPERTIAKINFIQIAHEVGNRIYANTVAAGAILGLMDAQQDIATEYLREFFAKKGSQVVAHNITALEKGYTIGAHTAYHEDITCGFRMADDVAESVFLSGSEAIGFGALAGGLNMMSSYPMSPATGVLTFLAQHGKECGVLVEQATDEIGAINMTLGAVYAGARGMVTTSGGGFCLMTESVSLSGMTETPIVIHIAQRPGPATGLPTRTAQEDLNLVLYAGHGEFMRVILAPGSPEEAHNLTALALDLADRYQIPVFVLTDQHFVDALFCVPRHALETPPITQHMVKTQKNYKRYLLTEDGISPRGIPGYGEGLVMVDSDEHDEEGRITEDMEHLRPAMAQKRFAQRKKLLREVAVPPVLTGVKAYKILVISWGSNQPTVAEAVAQCKKRGIAHAHFSQIFPLHKSTKTLLKKAKHVVVVENNAQGQFADLLIRETGGDIQTRITKNNGQPFSVEELTARFNTLT